MSWAYNNIDIYVTDTDDLTLDTSVTNWVPLSNYGILRGRPSLTLSTVEGDTITIKKKDGRPLSIDSSRKNAKLEFEILVVDTWVFTDTSTVQDRVDILMAMLNSMKRVSYKEPGKEPYFYYVVYSKTLTLTDADEKAATIKVSLDIHPFEYFFTGNIPVQIPSGGTSEQITVNNSFPCSLAKPIYILSGSGTIWVETDGANAGVVTAEEAPSATVIDTFRGLAYGVENGEIVPRNRYFEGDYENLWLPKFTRPQIKHTFSQSVVIFLRKGLER